MILDLFKKIIIDFLSSLGFFWLVVETFSYFVNQNTLRSTNLFLIIIFISTLFALFQNWPWGRIRYTISGTDAKLTIRFSNIMKEKGHIVMASSNFFNTSLDIISHNSILGQLIIKEYSSDHSIIDKEIDLSINSIKSILENVSRGKKKSYPIGTVASFSRKNNSKIFLIAITQITEINGKEYFESNKDFINTGLRKLWEQIEHDIDDESIAMTPLGGGISRAFPRTLDSILFISQSFINRVRIRRPCSELKIFVKRDDISLKNYYGLKNTISFLVN